ncbi:MAG: ABC transporter substrate-binding protein [Deltaproteobacteria bacterium]|nr:ABC transporter substrate-binding protein [Deltaproteobacteria bacterium]
MRPTHVVLQEEQRAMAAKYRSLGIEPVIVSTERISDIYGATQALGRKFDREEEARAFIARLRGAIGGIRAQARDLPHPRTLIVVGHEPGSLRGVFAAGPGSFHDELLEIAGGTNALDAGAVKYVPLTKDEILRASPEVVLILSGEMTMPASKAAELRKLWEPLASVEAVRTGRVHVVRSGALLVPGPRAAEAAQKIFERIHLPGKEEGL